MTLHACLSFLCFALGVSAALAQPTILLRPVVVTGSLLPQEPTDLTSPITVIDRREIERWGHTSAGEVLAALPFNTGGPANPNNADGGSNPGYASVSLRGMGANATLVLVNGRRIAPFGFSGSAVDLDSIPIAAIQRIEIIRDGGSALYGADAVAGVVNFILRAAYTGAELRVAGSAARRTGSSQVTATFGDTTTGDRSASWLITLDRRQQRALRAADRDFASTAVRPDRGLDATSMFGFPGAYSTDLSSPYVALSSSGLACDPGLHRGAVRDGEMCRYDYVVDGRISPRLHSQSAFGQGRFTLTDSAEIYTELLLNENRFGYQTSATPYWGGIAPSGEPYVLPSSSVYNPFSSDVQVWSRTTALGPRTTETRSIGDRALLGLKWSSAGWDVDSTVGTSGSRVRDDLQGGHVSDSRLRSAITAGDIDPLGVASGADLLALRNTQIAGRARQANARTDWLDSRATTKLVRLLNHDIGLAAGIELRRERLDDTASDLLSSGDVLGIAAPISPVSGGRRRAAATYAELAVPVLTEFNVQIGARADWYSDFGFAWSPKLSGVWAPVPWGSVRASTARSFRAPSLSELHAARTTSLTGPLSDPVRCPNGVARPGADPLADCDAQFGQIGGGNPNLEPEKSTSSTVGFVVRPVSGWSLGITYWQIAKTQNIGIVRDATVLDPVNYQSLSRLVRRGPASDEDVANGLPGRIFLVDSTNQNLGRSRFAGWDFELAGQTGPVLGGVVGVSATSALIVRAEQELTPGRDRVVLLDRSMVGTPIQRWRHSATVAWQKAIWNVGARLDYIGSYQDENTDTNGEATRVGRWWALGINAGFSHRQWEVGAAVTNLFNRSPPFSNKTSAFAVGWDDVTHDPRGRAIQLFLRYTMR